MNRAERRRATRKKSSMTNPSLLSLKEIREQAAKEVTGLAFKLMLSLPVIALNRYWGFGRRRCERFAEQCLDLYNEFSKGELTEEQLETELYRLGGLTIVKDTDTV